jgi:transposase-like protein
MKIKRKDEAIITALRPQVLNKLNTSSVAVSKLAKDYGVSKSLIYKWCKHYNVVRPKEELSNNKARFIELSVIEERPSNLQKASLIFDDFQITIEGSSSKLLAIINGLGKLC